MLRLEISSSDEEGNAVQEKPKPASREVIVLSSDDEPMPDLPAESEGVGGDRGHAQAPPTEELEPEDMYIMDTTAFNDTGMDEDAEDEEEAEARLVRELYLKAHFISLLPMCLTLRSSQSLELETNEEKKEEDAMEMIPEAEEALSQERKTDSSMFEQISNRIPLKQRLFLKPHQKEGVAFLYERIVLKKEGGVLAHSMGLGKTFQIVVFTGVFFQLGLGKTLLVVAPKSTLGTWIREFRMWTRALSFSANDGELPKFADAIRVFDLSESSTFPARKQILGEWRQMGGVLIVSYNLYTTMIGEGADSETMATRYYRTALTGDENIPSLLVCDEGHKIKNPESLYTRALSRIRTRNRIILTGTPIQNNFSELYCMLRFVLPNFMARERFKALYEDPITAGSRRDSTAAQVRRMKEAAFALHKDVIDVSVHRRGPEVLEAVLPPKFEYVIKVAPTDFQRQLYQRELDAHRVGEQGAVCGNLFAIVDTLRKICNHTDLLLAGRWGAPPTPDLAEEEARSQKLLPPDYEPGLVYEHGSKMLVLLDLVQQAILAKEKILVFSQWTATLDLIEEFLRTHEFVAGQEPGAGTDEFLLLRRNTHYYRLDGQTRRRQELIDAFNKPGSPAQLFLISTLAGGLGISLTGATRVILFDISWNPASDYQATCRTYRYGQTRPVYIYRLVQAGTVEESIWNRSCAKTWLSKRVVDQKAAARRLTKDELVLFEPDASVATEDTDRWIHVAKDDVLLQGLMALYREQDFPRVVSVQEHESLFSEDRRDLLTDTEKNELAKDLAYQKLLSEERDAAALDALYPVQSQKRRRPAVPAGPRLLELARSEARDHRDKQKENAALARQQLLLRKQQELERQRQLREAERARAEAQHVDRVNQDLARKRQQQQQRAQPPPGLIKLDSEKRRAAQMQREKELENLSFKFYEIAKNQQQEEEEQRRRQTQASGTSPRPAPASRPMSSSGPISPPSLKGAPPASSKGQSSPSLKRREPAPQKLVSDKQKEMQRELAASISFKKQKPQPGTAAPATALVPPLTQKPAAPPAAPSSPKAVNLGKETGGSAEMNGDKKKDQDPDKPKEKDEGKQPNPAREEAKRVLQLQDQFKQLVARYLGRKLSQLTKSIPHDDLKAINRNLTKQYLVSRVPTESYPELPPEDRAALKTLLNRELKPRGLKVD